MSINNHHSSTRRSYVAPSCIQIQLGSASLVCASGDIDPIPGESHPDPYED